LAVDPGETTGLTVIDVTPTGDIKICRQEQIASWPLNEFVPTITKLLDYWKPDFVVMEAYHVYAWKLNEHTFSEVPTIQIIGALKALCITREISYGEQTAQTGKAFWSDERLKTFEVFFPGMKHARDSLRHALQFLVLGLKQQE